MSLFYAYFWLIAQLDLESRLEIISLIILKSIYCIIFQIPGMLLRILILLYPFLSVCPDYFSLKVFRNFSLSLVFWNFTMMYLSEVSLKLNTFMKHGHLIYSFKPFNVLSSMTCSCVISIMFRAPFYFVFHFWSKTVMLNLGSNFNFSHLFLSTFQLHLFLFYFWENTILTFFLIQVFNLVFPLSLSCSISFVSAYLILDMKWLLSLSENVTITFIKKYIFSAAFDISTFCNVSVFWFVLVHIFCVEVFLIWLRSFTAWFYLRPKG